MSNSSCAVSDGQTMVLLVRVNMYRKSCIMHRNDRVGLDRNAENHIDSYDIALCCFAFPCRSVLLLTKGNNTTHCDRIIRFTLLQFNKKKKFL